MAATAGALADSEEVRRKAELPPELHTEFAGVIPAWRQSDILPPALSLQELTSLRSWKLFLPRVTSEAVERNTAYVRARQQSNPKFFEQVREELDKILHNSKMLSIVEAPVRGSEPEEAFQMLLRAQVFAQGFLKNKQFHKALNLLESCMAIADALVGDDSEGGFTSKVLNTYIVQGYLFWRLLVRVNLGEAYNQFHRPEEAQQLLRGALDLLAAAETKAGSSDEAGEVVGLRPVGPRETVLAGACHVHLSRLAMELGDADEGRRLINCAIAEYECSLIGLSDSREDVEDAALVLSTAFWIRGNCDVRQEKYDEALPWFTRTLETIDKYADISVDCLHMKEIVEAEMSRIKTLQL